MVSQRGDRRGASGSTRGVALAALRHVQGREGSLRTSIGVSRSVMHPSPTDGSTTGGTSESCCSTSIRRSELPAPRLGGDARDLAVLIDRDDQAARAAASEGSRRDGGDCGGRSLPAGSNGSRRCSRLRTDRRDRPRAPRSARPVTGTRSPRERLPELASHENAHGDRAEVRNELAFRPPEPEAELVGTDDEAGLA